jgi:predicted RNA-binding Zn ribbon-like protein
MHTPSSIGTSPDSRTLCLRFANTAGDDTDHLNDYHQLIAWCQHQRALTEESVSRLHDGAMEEPQAAERAFRKAVALRGAVRGVFSAVAARLSPSERDLRALNRAVGEAFKHLRIVQTDSDFQWQWDDTTPALDSPLWLIACSAADLLTSEQRGRIRQCSSADCDWLFVDRSKNRSRRWCDMAECGNREKARRSRARKRAV